MYRKVTADMSFGEREQATLRFWKEQKIFEKSLQHRCDGPAFTFYDGPPTANGKPHIGHILTRVIKDIIPRYKLMQGYNVLRKAGWDTHGLPVELEVEKKLGINGKPAIEAFGVEPFIKECRKSVWTYQSEWEQMSDRVGFWADMDDPYITYENDYIESVWWALRRIWDQDLIYQGHKVVPYCPRCGTSLSSHEVAQGYQDVKEESIYVRFAVCGEADTYFAAWTTTPWTLPSNVALCVNPKEEYALIEVDEPCGQETVTRRYYMAGVLAPHLFGEDFRLIEKMPGHTLVGKRYEPLFPYAETAIERSGKAAFEVTADAFVTLSDGTGIVHIAPAFGEDDARIGQENDLAFVQLVGEDGAMSAETEEFAGVFCKDADAGLTKKLAAEGKLIRKAPYEHSYPFCWRCDTPLLYYARDTWFIAMTRLREQLMRNNAKVNWIPENIRDGRFGKFLENVIDWGISRERYWGTPLPIWQCDCGHRHMVGSVQELKDMATEPLEDVELHKPYIDAVRLSCPKCEGTMTRVSEVIDCWFDSGSMPFAQWHYPFENKERFEANFPADFISEAIDQTRGWFYTLMAIGTLLFDESPYRNVIVLGLVQDKDGQKMSKHKGNVVDPWQVLDRQGADAVRWYFYTASSPWLPSRFSADAVSEAQRKFMNTLWNTYAFYIMYARIDAFDPSGKTLDSATLGILDRWILSRLESLTVQTSKRLDAYDITTAARGLQDFVEDLSNWYVRRSRERFWQSENDRDKENAYLTLYRTLETLTRLCAPFVPFMAEAMYQNLVRSHDSDRPESVHLCDYPKADESLIDPQLEQGMEFVLRLVVLGRSARNTAAIKNRQPLASLHVVSTQKLGDELAALVQDELNVKALVWEDDEKQLQDYRFKPQLRTLGRRFGPKIPALTQALLALDGRQAMRRLEEDGQLSVNVDGQPETLAPDDLLIETVQAEGLSSESDQGVTVALDTTLTEALRIEGFVREIISKVQTMRKEADFDVQDTIVLRYRGNPKIAKIIESHRDKIASEVLAERIEAGKGGLEKEWDLNGETCHLSVEKAR